jgi:uncharacterized protein (DUF488 family)
MSGAIKVFTIGFTQKSAQEFFFRLARPEIKRLLDVRLNNVSQLAGFTKKEDLRYFCKAILCIDYMHVPELAPEKDMLEVYKKNGGNWAEYEDKFLELLAQRKVEERLSRELIHGSCLLCSEPTPEHCHRRLVTEYLKSKWGDVEIEHIL